MSAVIRGMKKPKTCGGCDISLLVKSGTICSEEIRFCLKNKTLVNSKELHPNCPIIAEIPTPHGQLIDANRAAITIEMMTSHPCGNGIESIDDIVMYFRRGDADPAFPTIISAED